MSGDVSVGLADLAQAFQPLLRVIERTVRELRKLFDWFVSALAAEGIAELEMDLKLRSEVALRTDLLALFDP